MAKQPALMVFGLRRAAAAVAFALLLFGGALPALAQPPGPPGPPVQAQPPIPPGMARIWFYREYEPWESLATPYVRLNGAIVGVSQPGGAFYRDVAPGTYLATADSYGVDVNQFATVAVVPGQQVYIKVLPLRGWAAGGAKGSAWERDTFYTWNMLPQVAQAEMARTPIYNGG